MQIEQTFAVWGRPEDIRCEVSITNSWREAHALGFRWCQMASEAGLFASVEYVPKP